MSKKGNGEDANLPAVTAEAAPDEAETSLEAAPEGAGLAESPPPEDEKEALRRERDELKDTLLRRRADFENYRKRVERDRNQAATDAEATILREVLGTLDNLERALASDGTPGALRHGVELTHRELLALLESHGVVVLDPVGAPFDPAFHQALLHEPVEGLADGTVAEVYRKGYKLGNRLLRPALVKVAKAWPGGTGGEDDGGDVQ